MRIRFWIFCRVVICAVGLASGRVSLANTIADFTADFQPTTPKAGWSYLWNATAPVSDTTAYAPLQYATFFGPGYYASTAQDPAPSPAGFVVVNAGFMHPGYGFAESGDGFQRYAIAAFTLSAGGETQIEDLAAQEVNSFNGDGQDGVNLYIGVNGTQVQDTSIPIFGSYTGSTTVDLGSLAAGDTVYVAIGSNSNFRGDGTDLQFQIDQATAAPLPLPLWGGLLLFAWIALWRLCIRPAGYCLMG